jgi:SAM-dependent methyltransferase
MYKLHDLYRVDHLPIFQNRMYDTELEARNCPKGDMHLVEDLTTGLVYNAQFRPELMVYDKHYQNEQAVSPLFQQHLDAVANIIDQRMGKERIVEVGCGKGHFLETLLTKGFDVTGFDPTYEGENQRVKRQYFAPGMIEKANGLILRHVLEHIQNPIGFLEQLKITNGGSGKIYIEVPCFDWICEHKAWFDIFYEHVNYFRLKDFKRIFGEVVESGRLFGGQYLYVIAELASLKTLVIDINDRVNFPSDFDRNIKEQNRTEQNRTVIWGGSSKGVIFALLKARAGQPVTTVIDINPAKQGKFLPGTGLQVKAPDQGLAGMRSGSTIYVMNSNYLEEIKQMSNHNFNYIEIDHE